MLQKPSVFISSTGDLRSARDLVAKVLHSMGYEPVWQDVEPTDGGDLLGVLRQWMEPCQLMIQLVGSRYGAEPPEDGRPAGFGRVSFTQYEALYFEQTLGRKVIYLLLGPDFPADPAPPEPPERVALQADYRRRIAQSIRLHHPGVPTAEALELSVRRMSDDLAALRRQSDARYRRTLVLAGATLAAVAAIGAMVVGGVRMLKRGQAEQTAATAYATTATTRVIGDLVGRLDESESLIKQFLAERPLDSSGRPIIPQLTGDLRKRAEELIAKGDKRQRLVAAVAMNDFSTADRLQAEIRAQNKTERDAEDFDLAMLESDRWYRADQPDKAVDACETALRIRPDSIIARNHASIANLEARRGDLAAHRRRAVEICQGTLGRVPLGSADWAMTQGNLGLAWQDMETGDRAENLTKAVAAYEAALTVITRDADPVHWARIQNLSGLVWWRMQTGLQGENLTKAVAAYEAALTVFTRDAAPADWAATQNNLGLAWLSMPTGDRGENLTKAVAAYEAALTVRTRGAAPADWAATQNNLGLAWLSMPTGDRGENLTKAVAAYEAALTVFTRDADPAHWAAAQVNVGNARQAMPTGDRAENLTKAIAAYEAALQVFTRDADPAGWATTQNNLGGAWVYRSTGDRGENLRKAVAAYEAALTVLTRDADAARWATAQSNLAITFVYLARRPEEDLCGRLRQAIACDKAALTVHTPEAFPRENASTAKLLGGLRKAYETGGWADTVPFDDIRPAE